jgi:selenide,water dikinase
MLNAVGRAALNAADGIHAATDVTGFGLAGHAAAMAEGSRVTVEIEFGALPVIEGSEPLAIPRYHSRATGTNRAHLVESERLRISTQDHPREAYAFDPQTSGGLLVAVAHDRVNRFIAERQSRGAAAASVVGHVLARDDSVAVVLR